MNPTTLNLCAATLLLCTTTVFGQDCKGLKDLQANGGVSSSNAFMHLLNAVWGDDQARADCGSLTSVLDSVANRKKIGGRKLEEDRPFDPNEAQANLVEAQSDPAVRQRLEQIRKDVPDSNQRLLYEAAILDEEGYYSARDMHIRQLQQQLK